MSVDAVDLAILEQLRADARMSISELAERVHVSRSTVYSRMDGLSTAGVIEGYSVRMNPRRLGLDVTAFIKIKVDQGEWQHVTEALRGMPQIEYAAGTTGEFDTVVLARVRDLDELRTVVIETIHRIPGVHASETFLVLEEVVRRPGVLPAAPE